MTVTLKERDTNLLLVNGTELLRRNRTSFVSEGAKFNFSKIKIAGSDLGPNEEEFISARGPILGPIVVLAASEIVNARFDNFSRNFLFIFRSTMCNIFLTVQDPTQMY